MKVCFKGKRAGRLAEGAQEATGTTFDLDDEGCVTNVEVVGQSTSVTKGFLELVDADLIVNVRYGAPESGSAVRDGFVSIDPRDAGRNYGVRPLGGGICQGQPGATWDEPSILAHEFGHVYADYIAGLPSHATAIAWENWVHKRAGRTLRHPRCY